LDDIAREIRERTTESFLDFLILNKLANSPSISADELMDFVHHKLKVSLSLGILYSHLYYLEKSGLVYEDHESKKHVRVRTVYKITQKGKEKIDLARKHKSVFQCLIDPILE